MSNPFVGQICIVGFNFAPLSYAQCDGALLSIAQNQSLFALLGTTFGGDGRSTFGLPDLRSRVAIHIGNFNGGTNHALGNKGGEENHTLITGEMPGHDHKARATDVAGTNPLPPNQVLARSTNQVYHAPTTPSDNVAMNSGAVSNTGANQGHANQQPYGVLTFMIALQGVFPSRN